MGFATALLLAAGWLVAALPALDAGVALPGLEAAQLEPRLKGLALIEELNCVACHQGDPDLVARSRKAPRLSDVGSRVNPAHLESFIREPHAAKPGTTMPDVLSGLDAEGRARVARSITHFLLSLGRNDFALQPPDAVAAGHGRQLFHSRGCAHCHSPRDDQGREILPDTSVPLGALEAKYGFRGLVEFLARPHATRPSGRMPDMQLGGRDAERIAHYLLQKTRVPGRLSYTLYRGRVFEGLDSEEVTAERAGHAEGFGRGELAKPQHHTAIRYEGWIRVDQEGAHVFHLTWNGGELRLGGKPVAQLKPSDRRGPKEITGSIQLAPGRHAIELTYFHTGHEPRFSMELEGPGIPRGPIAPERLSVSAEDIPAFQAPRVDAGLASAGRQEFSKHGCANCHDDVRVAPVSFTPWAALRAGAGCMGTRTGRWPAHDLSAAQREWIHAALPHAERPVLDDLQRVNKTLAALNCIACHPREGLGGVAPGREALFTGSQPALGDQGRLPPPLTGVGAKLNAEWLGEVLRKGRRQRDYLAASMPRFGEAHVGHLVELLGKVDVLEAAPIPEVTDAQAFKDAGHAMVGSSGLGCIACHEFNGQKAGEASALDIARAPERLRKNWFHLYLREPSRFHPTVIMPAYWPGGRSAAPQFLGGDAGRQIEAIWTYLSDGTRARKPAGLSRQSDELRVADVPEICRGQGPVGYRSIGVGYPERIHLAFDAGEMALRQLWKGDFASVSPGHFRPKGTDLVSLPPGIPFHRLASEDDPWPSKGKLNHAFPQDHGYQFRGYHLDARRRPTFRYQFGEVAVEDFFEDVRDPEGKAFFRRTLKFTGTTPQAPFLFRAAAGKSVQRRSDREFSIDTLRVRITSDHVGRVRAGEPGDVLIPVAVTGGPSILSLEYQW